MRKFLLGAVALMSLGSFTAQATPISGTFSVNIWNGFGGGNSGDARVQALPTNPLAAGTLLADFSFTGPINFTTGTNNIYSFFSSVAGSITGLSASELSALQTTTLSTAGFNNTSLIEISGTTATPISGIIRHDDGVSLYRSGTNLVNPAAAAPTSVSNTPYNISAGNFDLWYVEANGLPAVLTMDVPEPASLALLGAGLLGLGLVRRRRS